MRKRRYDTDNANNWDDGFSDDFEVTYTDDLPQIPISFTEDDGFEADTYDNDDYEPHRRAPRRFRNPRNNASGGRRPKEDLASPLRVPMRASTKFIEKIVHILLRFGPLLMVAAITVLTAFVFWMGHSAYGEPQNITAERNITLTVYLIIGGLLVLWGLCSFLFVLCDINSGRGLTFFILYYILSYGSLLLGKLLPDQLSLLHGLKSGLLTYGSLHPRIFTLSLLGIIAWIIRKIFR